MDGHMTLSKKQTTHLRTLEKKGRITPIRVVEDAKRKDSPLHSIFTWDLRKAAEAHWLDKAAEVIRTYKVIVRVGALQLAYPVYIRDPTLSASERGSIRLDTLKSHKTMAKKALAQECRNLAGSLRRAHGIAIVLGLEGLFQHMLDQILEMERTLDKQTAA